MATAALWAVASGPATVSATLPAVGGQLTTRADQVAPPTDPVLVSAFTVPPEGSLAFRGLPPVAKAANSGEGTRLLVDVSRGADVEALGL